MQGREGSAPRNPGDCLIRHAVLTECRSAGFLGKRIRKCNSEGICSQDRSVRSRLPTDWPTVTAAPGRPSTANWAAPGALCLGSSLQLQVCSVATHPAALGLPSRTARLESPSLLLRARQRSGRAANRNVSLQGEGHRKELPLTSPARSGKSDQQSRAQAAGTQGTRGAKSSPSQYLPKNQRRCPSGLQVPCHLHQTMSSLPGHILGGPSR